MSHGHVTSHEAMMTSLIFAVYLHTKLTTMLLVMDWSVGSHQSSVETKLSSCHV